MSQKLVLIDGHSILNRAFYGVPDLSNAEGLHTNAIYGFLNIMFKILEEEKPDYLAVAFDVHAPTFRHQMYEAYKGTRKPMPEELRQQVPVMKEVLKAMHITIMEHAGLEADDILGTLAKKAEQSGMEVSLVSGDRDLLQIATDHIKIRIPKTKQGRTEIEDYYAADVQTAYQVTPLQFIELKALMGDTADNIPGVPRVGEKTAQALMVEYGSLDNIYAHVQEISKKSIRESLIEHKNLAELSKTLATIKTDCDLRLDYDQAKAEGFYTPEAYTLCKRLEFKNLLGRFEKNAAATDTKITESFRIIEEKKEFLDLCRDWADWIMTSLPRTKYGGFQHVVTDDYNYMQLWDDTLFMTVLFLAKAGKIFGIKEYLDECEHQFLLHSHYLTDTSTGLWYHGWTFDGNHNFANALWGRGNCWITAFVPEFIEIAENSSNIKPFMTDVLNAQVNALKKYQSDGGLWHTLLNDEDSYLEVSASAGFAYGILKSVRMGLIDKDYASVALKGAKAVIKNIGDDGAVHNVSYGTGMGITLNDYKKIPICYMAYGNALVIMMLQELLRFKENNPEEF